MVHQQLALSSAVPSLKHLFLGTEQGDSLVPAPQNHPLALGLTGPPCRGPPPQPAPPLTAGPVAGNLHQDQKPVSYSRGI